jgi:hypothetical protein
MQFVIKSSQSNFPAIRVGFPQQVVSVDLSNNSNRGTVNRAVGSRWVTCTATTASPVSQRASGHAQSGNDCVRHWVSSCRTTNKRKGCTIDFSFYHVDMTEYSTELELMAIFAAAVLEHFEAVDNLANIVTLGSTDKFADAKLRTEQTSSKCDAAKLALERHRVEHNCRVGAPPARASSPDHHAQ